MIDLTSTSAPTTPEPPASPLAQSWRSDLDPDALPPTPQYSPAQRRVLVACLEQFATRGFEASSTRDIAALIGVQSPSLYRHFPSKEGMLSALVLVGYEHYHSRLLTAFLAAGHSPVHQLAEVIRAHVLLSCEYSRLTIVIQQELAHLPPETAAVVAGYRGRTVQLVEQILARGIEEGVVDVAHLRTTITLLGGMSQASALTFPYRHDLCADEYAAEYVDLALRLVGATPVPVADQPTDSRPTDSSPSAPSDKDLA